MDPQKLKTYTEQHPDAYLKEIAQHFNCKAPSIYAAMVKHKLTRKKNFHLPRKIPRKRIIH
ncbi:MAG: transposase [Nitrososphaerota archaeon]|nr:transposase [Nitrososphaerota archaeon]